MNIEDHGHQGAGVAVWQSLDTLHFSVPSLEISNAGYFDPESIGPDPFTDVQTHEPQSFFLSGISQLTLEALARDCQSQSSPILPRTYQHDAQHRSPTPVSCTPTATGHHETNTESPSASLLGLFPNLLVAQPSIPVSHKSRSDDASDGKRKIPSTRATFTCPFCKESFSSLLRCRKHTSHRCCQASLK